MGLAPLPRQEPRPRPSGRSAFSMPLVTSVDLTVGRIEVEADGNSLRHVASAFRDGLPS
jgi:hypothetical protein